MCGTCQNSLPDGVNVPYTLAGAPSRNTVRSVPNDFEGRLGSLKGGVSVDLWSIAVGLGIFYLGYQVGDSIFGKKK